MGLEAERKILVDKHHVEIMLSRLFAIKHKLFCVKGLRWLENCLHSRARKQHVSYPVPPYLLVLEGEIHGNQMLDCYSFRTRP